MTHPHNIREISEKNPDMKGLCNSAAQSTAEIYEVQKYFNLATERKVLHLLCLHYRETSFETQAKYLEKQPLQQKIVQSTYAREENKGQEAQYSHIKLRHGKNERICLRPQRKTLYVYGEESHVSDHGTLTQTLEIGQKCPFLLNTYKESR